jgi:hypothetical protein
MYYIGLDVHKKTISYCVKDGAGHVHREGKIGSTRRELDAWIVTLPQPRTMEATIFAGWIFDHLLPHAEAVEVAHPLMLRAIALAKKKNDRIDAGKIADCLRCDFLPECHMASTEIRDRRRTPRYRLVRSAWLDDGHLELRGRLRRKSLCDAGRVRRGNTVTWSTMRAGRGAVFRSSLSPSCFCIASKIVTPSEPARASTPLGVH